MAAIAEQLTSSICCALARTTPKDVERAGEAVKKAKRPRVHVFCATSKIHRDHKLRKGKEEIIRISVESIKQALAYTADVEFSPEDAARTELDFLTEVVERAIEAGATTVNIPDTVGYAVPEQYAAAIRHLKQHVRGIDNGFDTLHPVAVDHRRCNHHLMRLQPGELEVVVIVFQHPQK